MGKKFAMFIEFGQFVADPSKDTDLGNLNVVS